MPFTIVEGWTKPIAMILRDSGSTDADQRTDLTGASVELRLYDKAHAEILEAGATGITLAVSGEIEFVPSGVDFVEANSPNYARVKITDALGQVSFHPSDDPDVWTVRGVGP